MTFCSVLTSNILLLPFSTSLTTYQKEAGFPLAYYSWVRAMLRYPNCYWPASFFLLRTRFNGVRNRNPVKLDSKKFPVLRPWRPAQGQYLCLFFQNICIDSDQSLISFPWLTWCRHRSEKSVLWPAPIGWILPRWGSFIITHLHVAQDVTMTGTYLKKKSPSLSLLSIAMIITKTKCNV